MKQCSHCQTSLPDYAAYCMSCGMPTDSAAKSAEKKICPKCQAIYIGGRSTCPDCGIRLMDLSDYYAQNPGADVESHEKPNLFFLILALVVPMLGLLSGFLNFINGNKTAAVSYLTWAISSTVLGLVLSVLLWILAQANVPIWLF